MYVLLPMCVLVCVSHRLRSFSRSLSLSLNVCPGQSPGAWQRVCWRSCYLSAPNSTQRVSVHSSRPVSLHALHCWACKQLQYVM